MDGKTAYFFVQIDDGEPVFIPFGGFLDSVKAELRKVDKSPLDIPAKKANMPLFSPEWRFHHFKYRVVED